MYETAAQLIQTWGELGAIGLALLAATYIVGALAFVPRPALCLLGGVVFGFAVLPLVLVACTVGAIAGFLLSRHLLRSYVRQAVEGRPQLQAVAEAVDAEGWRLVVLLRLSPIPGTAMNYMLGVTNVRLPDYAAGTLLGIAPSVSVFVYLGAMSATILAPQSVSRAHFAFLAAGLVAVALAAWLIARKARAILAERLRVV
jgi:uncharacterized membrane protein YdjX (TVP38/TMEM64 family)